jgi:signal transduction histidine kinase
MPPSRRPGAALAGALGAVFVLFAVLGTLQYRWAGELGEAARGRLRAAARSRAEAMAREFDLEVTRAFTGLAVSPDALREGPHAHYGERYELWRRAASYPEMVAAVYALTREGAESLLRYDAAARAFVPAEWPDALARARAGLLEMLEGRPAAGERGRRRPAGPIVEDVPAIVALPFAALRARGGPPPVVTIVVLDRRAIVERVFPALAQRHFGGADGLEYHVDVVRQQDHGAFVWRSAAGAPPPRRHDAAAGVFDIRFEGAGPVRGGPGFGGVRAHTEDTGAWRLLVSLRAGPLDDVVAGTRRRNLAVGFGVLVLLGAAVALVVASAQRARRLAGRQMDFVAAVSHELRTPVAVIRSTSENLADGVTRDPGKVREYGVVIRDEAVRLGDMIERVLEFAGTIARPAAPGQAAVSVADVVERALGSFRDDLARRGFTVEARVAPALPDVRGDAFALRRALENLVENAIKYDEGGRWLAVRAAAGDRGRVRIEVEDHGPGIAAGDLGRVFEPFVRGREARGRGFGLGLSLVRRIAEDHGGSVSARSERGGGTTFTLELPAAAPAAAAPETADALPHPRR